MRSLFLLTLGLLIGLGMAVGAVRAVGAASPATERLHLIGLVDLTGLPDPNCAAPCWIGIVPGQTTITMARIRLNAMFGPETGYRLTFYRAPRNILRFLLSRATPLGYWRITILGNENGIVNAIHFQFYQSYVRSSPVATAADLTMLYGPPDRLLRSAGELALTYGTLRRGILIYLSPGERIRPEQPVRSLVLYSDRPPRGVLAGSVLYHWQGFSRISRYRVP